MFTSEDISLWALSECDLCWSGVLYGERGFSAQPKTDKAEIKANRIVENLYILFSLQWNFQEASTYALKGIGTFRANLFCSFNLLLGDVGSHFVLRLASLEFLPECLVITHAGFNRGCG